MPSKTYKYLQCFDSNTGSLEKDMYNISKRWAAGSLSYIYIIYTVLTRYNAPHYSAESVITR